MGKITAGSWSYTLTDEDKLWAARMLQFEGGNPAATIWTMTQAYAKPGIHSHYPTFTAFIRSYSQPINPIWALGGSRCPTPSDDPSSPCYRSRLATRARAAAMPFNGASQRVQNTVNLWFAGKLPNPVPRAVEFADATVGQHYLDSHPGSQLILRDGNLYIATADSAQWHADFVRIAETGATVLSVVIVGGVLAAAGWWYYRRRKRRRGLSGLGGVQEDAVAVNEEVEDAYYGADWIWQDKSRPYDPEDGPRDRRRGWASRDEGRESAPVTTIHEEFDCNDLNKTIKKLSSAKLRLQRFVYDEHQPEDFDNVLLPMDYPDQPVDERVIDPDYVERWEELLGSEIETMRRVARANGCSSIAGLRGRAFR